MVCMHPMKPTRKKQALSTNERLRELVEASGLTQAQALEKFNEDIGLRPIAMSTWKGYFVNPDSTRWRGFAPILLGHAEHVLGKRKARKK